MLCTPDDAEQMTGRTRPTSRFSQKVPVIAMCRYRLLFPALLFFSASGLLAQEAEPPVGNVEARPGAGTTSTGRPEPGYREGVRLLFFSAGPSLSNPAGSYIKHEKLYDQRLRDKINIGTISRDEYGLPAYYVGPTYEQRGLFLFEYEQAITDHFGIGFSSGYSEINSRRQDISRAYLYTGSQILERRQLRDIYHEGFLTFSAAWHFVSNSVWDPFIKVRGGVTFYGGDAHREIDLDYEQRVSGVSNGRGWIYGGGVGLLYHVRPEFAFSIEAIALERRLQADQFSSRSLASANLNVGIVMLLSPDR